jgi:ubiquinone/menaquinone biosynthesis C-methylase UbiE
MNRPMSWPKKWPRKWLDLPRVPEPEVMDDSGEVEAYSSAAAEAYLNKIDDTFVEHAERLLGGRSRLREAGRALDIGCGPGQIVLKLAQRLPGWHFAGVDRSANMVRQALAARDQAARRMGGDLASRVQFFTGDGSMLPFADASVDLVVCNSVLHHLEQPLRLFAEIARVATPGGAILVRDLRRPSRPAYPLHVRWHGRHYSGLMHKLYCDSVRAAYTPEELAALLSASPLRDARIFMLGRTHLGFERPAR